jgi:plastocyanin
MTRTRSCHPIVFTARPVVAFSAIALIDSAYGTNMASVNPTPDMAELREPRICEPVDSLQASKANQTVGITATDFAFAPTILELGAGVITFEVANKGGGDHELAFLRSGRDVSSADGIPDESDLEAEGAVESAECWPDQTCKATYELDAGTYTLFCIVRTSDGKYHYDKGIRAMLTVA